MRADPFSFYIRDRWTIGDNLTLDYGTRWEYFPLPTRPDRGIERYDATTNKVLLCGIGDIPTDCGIKASKTLFAPRVGMAYRIGDKWVVRAGYGLTNDPYYGIEIVRANYPILTQLNLESPNGLTPAATLAGGIPAITGAGSRATASSTSRATMRGRAIRKELNRGYIQSWNFTVQRELPWKFTGQIGYVGTHSTRQLGLRDINAGQVIGAGEEGRPLQQQYGRTASTVFLQPVGKGQYNSMQAQLHRRFADGLSLSVNYTLARAKSDNENSSLTPDVQALAYSSRNYALISTDRTHNVGITNSWELPFGPDRRWLNDGGVLSYIARRVAGEQPDQHDERSTVHACSPTTRR